ncbi:MAG TPA: DUF2339 domain-containing protein [Hyphomonadaceae bacterium]|jgi:uncharacterized membrane protein|nr:DUF2339 domain-containing protein [Hyphomonadaceae bacterium]
MELLPLLLVLLGLVLVLTPIFAFIAYARTGDLRREVETLRREIASLRSHLQGITSQEAPEGRPRRKYEERTATDAVFEEAPPPEPAAAAQPPEPAAPEPARPAETPPQPAAEPAPGFDSETEREPEPQPTPQPEPVYVRSEAQPEQPSWSRTSSNLERTIASNWLVWVGALALALGGIFLVRFAWEQGYFGPAARTIAAVVIGAAMIGASEWLRRKADPDAPGQMRFAPLAVATAGAVTLYAAAYAAGPLYELVPQGLALAGFVAASIVAIALAVVHGSFLAVLGLIGGYAAPILVGGGVPDPVLVLAYVFAVTAAALLLVRVFSWRQLVWVALLGSGAWTLIAIDWMHLPSGPFALAAYLTALVAASTWLAWRDANTSPLTSNGAIGETAIAANGFWLIAAAGLATPIGMRLTSHTDPLLIASLLLAVAGIVIAWRRKGFELAPLFSAACTIGIAAALADNRTFFIGFGAPPDAVFPTYASLAAAITGIGGWLAMFVSARRVVFAIVSAFAPVLLLLIAFILGWRGEQDGVWALPGVALAVLNLLSLEILRRDSGGLDSSRGAAASYALAAFSASLLAVMASLNGVLLTAVLALHLPAIAIIDRRFNLKALRLCTSIAGLIVMSRLLWPETVLGYAISPQPIFNELLLIYGGPIIGFWLAARIYARTLEDREHTLVQALDTAAIAATAAFLSVEIRHLVTGGNLAANYQGMVETSAYAVAFTGMALGMSARMGARPRLWLAIAEKLVFAIGGLAVVIGLLLLANPLLNPDLDPKTTDGPFLINLMAASYAPPALMLGLYGFLKRRQGNATLSNFALHLTALLLGLWVALEIRNAFHVDVSLWREAITLGETGAYALMFTGFALILCTLPQAVRVTFELLERLTFAAAIVVAIFGLGMGANPLLSDYVSADADGPLLFNAMTFAYLAPAAILLAYAMLRRAEGRITTGHVAGFTALALTLLYATLEVRNAWHASLSLGAEPVLEAEAYTYSAVWIVFAIVTLAIGLARHSVPIRHAGMAVLLLSVAKVFLVDMASLGGVLRAASFLGLGVALIGIAFLYQRLIFRPVRTG